MRWKLPSLLLMIPYSERFNQTLTPKEEMNVTPQTSHFSKFKTRVSKSRPIFFANSGSSFPQACWLFLTYSSNP